MNKKQKLKLEYAASLLSRADETDNLQGIARAHKVIKKTMEEIYKSEIDVPMFK